MQSALATTLEAPMTLERGSNARSRTFRGPDVRGALAAVKAALGADAIILATREIPKGMFRAGEVEITATMERERPLAHEPRRPVRYGNLQAVAPASLPAPESLNDALLDHFLDRGISRAFARIIVRSALANGARDVATANSAARTLISGKLHTMEPPWKRDRRRVVALVGPSGVGKTTTIAKIAARALIESRLSIALITIDTYRIGASNQLQRYGEIMRLPTFVARDVAELSRALERTSGADLVLVDTAGRSAEGEIARQARMLTTVKGVDTYLTMSVTGSARDLEATVDRYRFLNPERLVLTKADEAAAPGSFLAAAMRLGRPITCVANGQRVPDDIREVTNSDLVEMIMGDGLPGSDRAASDNPRES